MIKRNTPLKRKTPLRKVSSRRNYRDNSNSSEETLRNINKFSDKRQGNLKIYSHIRTIFLSLFGNCKAQLNGCTHYATEIHHQKGRGIYLLIIKYFLPVCRNCHDWIGINSEEAIEKGLSISRNRQEVRYLQPHNTDTIAVLLKMQGKIYFLFYK